MNQPKIYLGLVQLPLFTLTLCLLYGSVNDNYFGKQMPQESMTLDRSRGLFNTGLFAIQSESYLKLQTASS